MSYILDALRRAEAERERERGQMPGPHAQPPVPPVAQRRPASRRWQAPLIGFALLALLAGLAAWLGGGRWWSGAGPSAPVAAPAPAAGPASAAATQTVVDSAAASPAGVTAGFDRRIWACPPQSLDPMALPARVAVATPQPSLSLWCDVGSHDHPAERQDSDSGADNRPASAQRRGTESPASPSCR